MTRTNKELKMSVIILFTVFGIIVAAYMYYVDDTAQKQPQPKVGLSGPLPGYSMK
jgi:hypothetical protein